MSSGTTLLPVILATIITALLFGCKASAGDNWEPIIADPMRWDAPVAGEGLMFSGTDPGGQNMDSGNFLRIEPEGASFQTGDWVLAEMEGPGAINRIWMTGKDSNGLGPAITGQLKIYVDRKDIPVIDTPIEKFFGKYGPFKPPFAQPTSGGWTSYLPIPFSTYCKVVVTDHKDGYAHRVNGLGETIPHLYYQVCWRKMSAGAKVEPFALQLSADQEKSLAKVSELFSKGIAPTGDYKNSTLVLEPGKQDVVYSSTVEGIIQEIRLSPKPFMVESLKDLWLVMRWDGEEKPAVEAPLSALFGCVQGINPYASLPVRVTDENLRLLFPMPYENGAQVVLENRGKSQIKVQAKVGYETASGPSPCRLHARYIKENLPAGPPDLVVADVSGRSGHFVGCALTINANFLEGNERFYVDGQDKPGWEGTGTEDYFNGGWYFCSGPYAHALSGCTAKGDLVSAYRWHLLDAVPFAKSLRMTLEHGHASAEAGLAEGISFWYENSE